MYGTHVVGLTGVYNHVNFYRKFAELAKLCINLDIHKLAAIATSTTRELHQNVIEFRHECTRANGQYKHDESES